MSGARRAARPTALRDPGVSGAKLARRSTARFSSSTRRAIVLAEVERRDADQKAMRARFAEINADPETARLESRLAVLSARVLDGQGRPRNAGDLDAISLQQRQAFYRCE